MARPANKRVFTRKMSLEGYFHLMEVLEQKTAILSQKRTPSVKLQLNKYENIQAVLVLLIYTGLRVSETRLITVGDIRKAISTKGFVIYEPKKRENRKVSVGSNAVKAFKKYFNEKLSEISNNNLIVRKYNRIQSPYSSNYLQVLINDFIHEVLGEEYTTHSFRRFVLTKSIKNFGVKEAQKIANHKDIKTTILYDTIEDDVLGDALDSIWTN